MNVYHDAPLTGAHRKAIVKRLGSGEAARHAACELRVSGRWRRPGRRASASGLPGPGWD